MNVEGDAGGSSAKKSTKHAVLFIGSFKLAPMPGSSAILDFHKIDALVR